MFMERIITLSFHTKAGFYNPGNQLGGQLPAEVIGDALQGGTLLEAVIYENWKQTRDGEVSASGFPQSDSQ